MLRLSHCSTFAPCLNDGFREASVHNAYEQRRWHQCMTPTPISSSGVHHLPALPMIATACSRTYSTTDLRLDVHSSYMTYLSIYARRYIPARCTRGGSSYPRRGEMQNAFATCSDIDIIQTYVRTMHAHEMMIQHGHRARLTEIPHQGTRRQPPRLDSEPSAGPL